jgi:hypothetical protein
MCRLDLAPIRGTGSHHQKLRNDAVERRVVMFRGAISLLAAAVVTAGLSRPSSAETVSVLYAGSLVNLMERGLAPAFGKATGDTLLGLAGGSNGLSNQIKAQQRHGDVFISADPKVNDDLKGAANGDWVSWYITFAQSPLVIGYNPSSRAAVWAGITSSVCVCWAAAAGRAATGERISARSAPGWNKPGGDGSFQAQACCHCAASHRIAAWASSLAVLIHEVFVGSLASVA